MNIPPAPLPPSVTRHLTPSVSTKFMGMIYGRPITGKTTGALTFPNPILLNCDNNIPAGIQNTIPLWSDKFVDTIKMRDNPLWPANRTAALMMILTDLARDLPAGYTIIVDSLTRVEHFFNEQEEAAPKPRGRKDPNQIDTREMFNIRLKYFMTLITQFSSCAANIVFLSHEQIERDDEGRLSGYIKPALIGQAGDKLPGFMPVVLRAESRDNPLKKGETEYVWQIRPIGKIPARVPKPTTIDFIPQRYEELVKFL